MAGPINYQPALHNATVTDSLRANDSPSQLQGARSIPVHSVLARHQNASPSFPTSGNAPDLRHARIRRMNSPNPRVEQTYHYLLDAARNLKEYARRSLWEQSFALIVRHMPGSYGYEHFYSLHGQPSAPPPQKLAVKQTDEIMAAVAASGNKASLPRELNNDVGRLVTGYLKWRKEQSRATEPISVSCCMELLKSLHRGVYGSDSRDDHKSIHEYLADVVSDKDAALSESAKLEQQSPRLALFMYKLMEHLDPGLSGSLGIHNYFLYRKPEVGALFAATRQGRIEIVEALTKDGGKVAQLQQQLLSLLQHDRIGTIDHLHHLKEMDEYQLQELLPLLQHDQAWTTEHLPDLKGMNGYQLRNLLPLLQHDRAWTNDHWPDLKKMEGHQLQELLPLLQHDREWTTKYLPHLEERNGYWLKGLLPLLQHDRKWTTKYLPHLEERNSDWLKELLPLLQHDREWTTKYLPHLEERDSDGLKELLPLLQHDREWTADHLDDLKKIEYHLSYLLPLLQRDRELATKYLRHFKKTEEDQLRKLSRFFSLESMDVASGGFTKAANPYVREALLKNQDIQDVEERTRVLNTHGASRSTFNPEPVIASYLTERFENNYRKIQNATFGVENEMFIPGIPEASSSKIKDELNEKLGKKNKRYDYVEDDSLNTDVPFATPPIEQTTSILDSPEDIQRLQSALSILNDWGAFTNHTAGVHIHTGIKQWEAADCLTTQEEKIRNDFLPQWDQDLSEKFPGTKKITPYQLLFMKQFLVNMVAMQKDFYLVSRESKHSMPNGPKNGEDLDKYYLEVSSAPHYEKLLTLANANNRDFNVNLLAYKIHGTIEVRGFTKKNSASMEIDPNLPVRDLIFMQEVLIKVVNETKNILLSGASPEDSIKVRPSEGLTEIVKEYVQDVFLLEIIHALGQRNPERRVKTMDAIMKDKGLIAPGTLQKIRESQASLLNDDPLAQHFLAALDRDGQWNPSSIEKKPLRRMNSLRSMADAGLSGHASKP